MKTNNVLMFSFEGLTWFMPERSEGRFGYFKGINHVNPEKLNINCIIIHKMAIINKE